MTTLAIGTMVTTMTIIVALTGYFFIKMLRTPRKPDDDTQ